MLQNVGFSLLILGALVPLAAFGVLGLAVVIVVHEAAEVLVILNGVRAARMRILPGLAAAPATAAHHHVTIQSAPEPEDPCCAPTPRAAAAGSGGPAPLSLVPISHTPDTTGGGCGGGCDCCAPATPARSQEQPSTTADGRLRAAAVSGPVRSDASHAERSNRQRRVSRTV